MTTPNPYMSSPRSAPQLLADTLGLYRRYPVLFLVLAAAVIVPYEAIAFAATGTGSLSRTDASAGTAFLLTMISWFLITPLISALHVHAVAEVRRGHEPRIGSVAQQGLRVLPVVVAATIISSLGIFLGIAALVVPGVILLLRWAVAAQAAAIEHEGWLSALRRSHELTDENYGHIFVFIGIVMAIAATPGLAVGAAFGHHDASPAAFTVGLAMYVATASFTALSFAFLFYELEARFDAQPQPALHTPSSSFDPRGPTSPPSLDPRTYSDQDRPKGWYVDPSLPNRMRYWHGDGGDPLGWQGTTRTPRKIRQAWVAEGEE